jgi:hypothetical protein
MPIERPSLISDKPDRYVGDGAVMMRLQAVHRLTPQPLDRQILDTASYLDGLVETQAGGQG